MLLLFTQSIYAQMQDEAIMINNKTDILTNPNINSDKIRTLQKNEAFLIATDQDNDLEWMLIEIPRNKFSKIITKSEGHYSYEDFFISGYILRSQYTLINSLQKYDKDDLGLIFKIEKADTKMIIDQKNMRYGLEVGLRMSYVVKEMKLICKGKHIVQDESFFDDLFNVSFIPGNYSSLENKRKFRIYHNEDYYYIKQDCGDGAGSYEITWVIKDGKIIQRLIDTI